MFYQFYGESVQQRDAVLSAGLTVELTEARG